MVLKGKLVHCKREVKEFEKRKSPEKLWISLADVKISDDQMEELKGVFKDSGKAFTPAWVKKFEGYVNVSTQLELPYQDLEGNQHASIEEGIKDGLAYMKAEVLLSLNLKEGAVYPNAIKFLSEGTPFNPFAEFDNFEED